MEQRSKFSHFCSADFGPHLPGNQLYNNKKIEFRAPKIRGQLMTLINYPQHPARHQDRHSGGETVEMAPGAKRTRTRQVLRPYAKEGFADRFNKLSI